jgi:hypothetical protein
MSRETLRAWERGNARVQVRASTARAITALASVAADVDRLVGDPARSGEWMLAAQPQLRGRTPAELARVGTAEARRELRRVIMPEIPPPLRAPVRASQIASARRRTRSLGLPLDAARARPRAGGEATVLRKVGDSASRIGPVVRD